jgi:hypothetical protein
MWPHVDKRSTGGSQRRDGTMTADGMPGVILAYFFQE